MNTYETVYKRYYKQAKHTHTHLVDGGGRGGVLSKVEEDTENKVDNLQVREGAVGGAHQLHQDVRCAHRHHVLAALG